MFSKISQLGKNFSEELARNINDSEGEVNGPKRTTSLLGRRTANRTSTETNNATNELKNGSAILQTDTPDVAEMTQPEDEPVEEGDHESGQGQLSEDSKESTPQPADSNQINLNELAPEIRSKMKKFLKYEEKYPILLEAYKVEKKKTELIGSFEKVLREHTPISTISDASSLVEYLKSLQDKTSMLNDEMRRMAGESSTLNKAKAAIEDRFRKLEAEYTELKSTTEKLENEDNGETIFSLSEEDNKETNANTESGTYLQLQDKIDSKQTAIEELKSQKQDFAAKISSLEIVVKDLENINTELTKKSQEELKRLGLTNSDLTEKIKTLDSEIVDLKKLIEDSESDKKQLTNSFSDLSNRHSELVSQLATNVEVLESRIDSLSKEITLKDEKILSLEESTEGESPSKNRAAPSTPTLTSSSKKKKNKKNKKKDANSDNPSDQNTKETETLVEEPSSHAHGTNNDIQFRYDQLKKDYQDLQAQITLSTDSNNEKLTHEFKELTKKYEAQKQEIETLKASYEKGATKDAEDSFNNIEAIKSELTATKNEMDRLSEEITNLKTEKKFIESERDTISASLNAKSSELEKYFIIDKERESIKKELESNSSRLKKVQNEFKSEKKDLEDKILQLEAEIELDKESRQTSSNTTNELRWSNEKLQVSLTNLKREIDGLKKENENLTKRSQELSEIRSNDTSLKLEIASLKATIDHKDKSINEYSSRLESLNSAKDKLNDAISDLKVKNSESATSHKILQKDNNTLATKNEILSNDVKALNKEINNLNIQKQALKNELDEIKLKYADTVKSKADSLDNATVFKKQCEELSMKSKEYAMRIETLEEEVAEARNMLQERTREASTMRQMLIDSEEQFNGKASRFKNEIKKLKEEKEELEESYNVVHTRKRRELDEARLLNENLKSQLDKIQRNYAALENKVVDIDSQRRSISESSINEVNNNHIAPEISKTIEILRDQLSNTNKKIKEYENSSIMLKKLNDDSNLKFERLAKNYKFLSQQYKVLKAASPSAGKSTSTDNLGIPDTSVNDDIDFSSRRSSISMDDSNYASATNIAYVKNVLLGFLEHKEQRTQLLPVVKTLLSLSNEDEKRLLSSLKP